MGKSSIVVLSFIAIASLMLTAGNNQTSQDSFDATAAPSGARQAAVAPDIMNYDFSDAIDARPIHLRGDSEQTDIFIGYKALAATAENNGDEKVLAAIEISGRYWTVGATLNMVSPYHHEHDGAFPENGAMLFPELSTPAGEAAFFAMSDQEKLEKYYAGVNPYTGKFYSSFDADEWRAGGLALSPLPDGFAHSAGPGKGQLTQSGGYTYKVYGTEDGSVLYEDQSTYAFGHDADTSMEQMDIDAEAFRAEADAQIQEHIENQDN